MKSREGLEERLEFLFPDEEERKRRRPEYDERLQIELPRGTILEVNLAAPVNIQM